MFNVEYPFTTHDLLVLRVRDDLVDPHVVEDAHFGRTGCLPFICIWAGHGFSIGPGISKWLPIGQICLSCFWLAWIERGNGVMGVIIVDGWSDCPLGAICGDRCIRRGFWLSWYWLWFALFLVAFVSVCVIRFEDDTLEEWCRAPFIEDDAMGFKEPVGGAMVEAISAAVWHVAYELAYK
jgi:hypothetical protein